MNGRFALGPIEKDADYSVSSHRHSDHCGVVANAKIVDSGVYGSFDISRTEVWHDEYDGTRFGGACDALRVEVDGTILVHLSDVGEAPKPLEFGEIDILFVPIGGYFTIGALQAIEWIRYLDPRIVVPIHFADPNIDLPLQPRSHFDAHVVPKNNRGSF